MTVIPRNGLGGHSAEFLGSVLSDRDTCIHICRPERKSFKSRRHTSSVRHSRRGTGVAGQQEGYAVREYRARCRAGLFPHWTFYLCSTIDRQHGSGSQDAMLAVSGGTLSGTTLVPDRGRSWTLAPRNTFILERDRSRRLAWLALCTVG